MPVSANQFLASSSPSPASPGSTPSATCPRWLTMEITALHCMRALDPSLLTSAASVTLSSAAASVTAASADRLEVLVMGPVVAIHVLLNSLA